MDLAWEGDRGAGMIDELYDSLYQELTGWCTAMAGSRTQAEDLVQEAFLRAMLNTGLLQELDAGKRRAWMYRTVKNLYIDRKRREAFETMVEQMPEEGIEDAEYAQVDDAQLLAVLTPEERMLFTLRAQCKKHPLLRRQDSQKLCVIHLRIFRILNPFLWHLLHHGLKGFPALPVYIQVFYRAVHPGPAFAGVKLLKQPGVQHRPQKRLLHQIFRLRPAARHGRAPACEFLIEGIIQFIDHTCTPVSFPSKIHCLLRFHIDNV